MSINRAVVTGNLTRDALLRTTASGTPVLTMSVAVDERAKRPDGTWGERTNYVECAIFGQRAVSLADWLRKGTHVAIEGHLRWQQWEKDGETRSSLSLVVDDIEFQSRRRAND